MEAYDPTPAQEAFIDTVWSRKIFFGPRQIGKSTAIALDAIEKARAGGEVVVSAPTVSNGRETLRRCREILRERDFEDDFDYETATHPWELTFEDGGYIEQRTLTNLYMSESDLHPSCLDEFDHAYIESIDFIEAYDLDTILDECDNHDIKTVGFTGTPVVDSPNVRRLAEDDAWFSVYDTLFNSDYVEEDKRTNLENKSDPVTGTTEFRGMFVTDPAERADFAPEQ